MNIQLIDDRVLVKPDDELTKTKGGLIIPDGAREKPLQGIVIEVGQKFDTEYPMVVKKGDRVLYDIRSGTPVELEGVNYLIMKETEIYAVLG